MSAVRTDNLSLTRHTGEDGYPAYLPPIEQRHERSSTGLILTGLVVLGLGILVWNYFGPDARRYLKISTM
jgi:hypothetical protein